MLLPTQLDQGNRGRPTTNDNGVFDTDDGAETWLEKLDADKDNVVTKFDSDIKIKHCEIAILDRFLNPIVGMFH